MFTDETGLSNEEAENRKRQYGQNILPEKPPPSQLSLLVQQLKNPFVYVLLSATVITFVIGHITDSLIIFLAVVINTILGFIQIRKTDLLSTNLQNA